MYKRPVLINVTRPRVGDDVAFIDADTFSCRVGKNTGNMAFLHAIMKTVKNIEHRTARKPIDADIKILGCANFIAEEQAMQAHQAEFRDETPVVAIGLGAQAATLSSSLRIPEGTVEWVRRIARLAPGTGPNISLRGKYTESVLQPYGLSERTVVLGCPSLFINPAPDLGQRIRERLQKEPKWVAAAPGNIAGRNTAKLERALCQFVSEYGGYYIVQSHIALFELLLTGSAQVNAEAIDTIAKRLFPTFSRDEAVSWLRLYARVFENVPSWLNCLRSVDVVVAARIHGAQLAIQAGTPALCLAGDARQVELCEMMRIPFVPAESICSRLSIGDVADRLRRHDWELFDRNRRELAGAYASFLSQNGLEPTEQLLGIADKA